MEGSHVRFFAVKPRWNSWATGSLGGKEINGRINWPPDAFDTNSLNLRMGEHSGTRIAKGSSINRITRIPGAAFR